MGVSYIGVYCIGVCYIRVNVIWGYCFIGVFYIEINYIGVCFFGVCYIGIEVMWGLVI